MDVQKQAQAFEDDLDTLINRYAEEFDLPVFAVIGILHLKIYEITTDAYEETEDD